jgi:RimJ/RimL family protein N-acetyltransferase
MKRLAVGGGQGGRLGLEHDQLLSGLMHILLTERLSLREFAPLDAPFPLAWAEGRLVKAYRELGHGFWAVQRREDGELLGMCGLFKRAALPEPDLGYALLAEHEGRGYALEAARACVDHARTVLGWPTLMAITALDNPPSVALLKKLGFIEQGQEQLEGYNEPSRVFRLSL